MPTFPLGHHAHQQHQQNQRVIAKIDQRIAKAIVHVGRRFEFPNPVDLRGIPAIGMGVAGAIAHTRPDTL